MRKLLAMAAMAASLTAVASSANAVAFVTLDPPSPSGVISGVFGNTGLSGSFTDTLTFTLPSNGTTSGTITSTMTTTTNNVDFTTVTLNGVPFTIGSTGTNEFRFINNLVTLAGLQTLVVSGVAGGEGSYSGTLAFNPAAAVPEPATWGMMILGLAMVGAGLRLTRRKEEEHPALAA